MIPPALPDLYAERGVPPEDREQWEEYRAALTERGIMPSPPLWALSVEGFPPYGIIQLTPLLPSHPAYVPADFDDDDIDEAKLLLERLNKSTK